MRLFHQYIVRLIVFQLHDFLGRECVLLKNDLGHGQNEDDLWSLQVEGNEYSTAEGGGNVEGGGKSSLLWQ